MGEQGNELEFDEEYMNLRPARLYELGTSLEGAQINSTGALAANSGAKTGRSPKDKRVVRNSASEGDVWWGSVNIALVNELKMVFSAMDIDVWEVIAAASTKPFGYMPFYPGPGWGGYLKIIIGYFPT